MKLFVGIILNWPNNGTLKIKTNIAVTNIVKFSYKMYHSFNIVVHLKFLFDTDAIILVYLVLTFLN